MITVFTWDDATKQGTWGDAAGLPPPDRMPDVLWIDLEEPTEDEEKLVFEQFYRIHALSFEDVQRPRRLPDDPPHFPKVEEFADYLFVIVNPISLAAVDNLLSENDEARCCGQLNAVLTHKMLITHHREPLVSVASLTGHLRKHPTQAARGPDFLFHHILDVMVDHYAPLMDHVDEALDQLEEQVFARPGPHLQARLLRLKRRIILLRKTLIYEREVLARLSRGEFELIDEREMVYYRNVYDHLLRFTELTEASREMVADLMQTLLASQSNRLNETMRALTMISVIGSVCMLIAGVYGMNFKHMPELDWQYGYPLALAMMAAAVVVILAIAKWVRWL